MAVFVLTGFSGSGKSTVASILAQKHGFSVVDVDSEIERLAGKSIQDLFRVDGETLFRAFEQDALQAGLVSGAAVVAVGGGALQQPGNRELIAKAGATCIYLEADVRELCSRLRSDREVERPLLPSGPDTEELESRIRGLLLERRPAYEESDLVVCTTGVTAVCVADLIAAEIELAEGLRSAAIIPSLQGGNASHSFVCSGGVSSIGQWLRHRVPGLQRVALVIDEEVQKLWGARIRSSLEEAQLSFETCPVPSGEPSKSLAEIERLTELFLERGLSRGDLLLAIGGGVVGDVAGLLGSLYMRGMHLVHVPTTVVSQVDSAIGGKTAVNIQGTRVAKNILGTVYPAKQVFADVSFLQTLSDRDFREGLAEVVKYAAIDDSDFCDWLEENIQAVLEREPETLVKLVRRSIAIKTRFVCGDEQDLLGKRIFLNFGHTLGHAVEARSGYVTFKHGEAVAIGMEFALTLSCKFSSLAESDADRIRRLLCQCGLPSRCDVLSDDLDSTEGISLWRNALLADKKRLSGKLQFVLLGAIGKPMTQEMTVDEILNALSDFAHQPELA